MADRHLIDVHVLLVRDDDILLTRRRDTNPLFDGLWHLPSGKLDAGESVLDAAVREAKEEVGVHVDPADLRLVHTLHVNGSGPEPRLASSSKPATGPGRRPTENPTSAPRSVGSLWTPCPTGSSTTRLPASTPTAPLPPSALEAGPDMQGRSETRASLVVLVPPVISSTW